MYQYSPCFCRWRVCEFHYADIDQTEKHNVPLDHKYRELVDFVGEDHVRRADVHAESRSGDR